MSHPESRVDGAEGRERSAATPVSDGAEVADGEAVAARGVEGAEPSLIVVCGLPGTGKTTVAGAVAERLDANRYRSDVIRKELRAEPDYTDAETRAVYGELFQRARRSLDGGTDVVLDATFRARSDRRQAAAVAAAAGASCTVVEVECETAVDRERIDRRTDDASDADFEIYLQLRDEFDPIEGEHATVDNSGSLAATRRAVRRLFSESDDGAEAERLVEPGRA
jgi:predicted kinase